MQNPYEPPGHIDEVKMFRPSLIYVLAIMMILECLIAIFLMMTRAPETPNFELVVALVAHLVFCIPTLVYEGF